MLQEMQWTCSSMLLFIITRLRLCSAEAEVTLSEMREKRGINTLKCPTEKKKVGKISGDVRKGCLQSSTASNCQHQTVKAS